MEKYICKSDFSTKTEAKRKIEGKKGQVWIRSLSFNCGNPIMTLESNPLVTFICSENMFEMCFEKLEK